MVLEQASGKSLWHVLYTLSRHEKKVHANLLKRQVKSFLPLQQQYRQWTDRKKKISMPLFPNYVFVNIAGEDRYKVFEIPGIVRYLDSNVSPTIISEHDISLIQLLMNGEMEVTNEAFEIDDEVMITSGPFKGLTGALINKKGSKRLVIEIDSLHKKVCVDVSPYSVHKFSQGYSNAPEAMSLKLINY